MKRKKLPVFEAFTEEEYELMDKLYHSPTWKALLKARDNNNAVLATSAYQFRSEDSFRCYEKMDGVDEFLSSIEQAFNRPEEAPVPESTPATLDTLIP